MLDFESKFDIFELKSSNLNIGRLNLNAEYYSSEVSKINLFLDRLREVCIINTLEDYAQDIYLPQGARSSMNYVDEFEGTPYLSPSETFSFPFKPNKYVHGDYEDFKVPENELLVTCSGSVGRCLISDDALTDFIISGDLIRVSIDEKYRGFIYAYLKSCFGQVLIVKDQYGSTVNHINPEHMMNVPVPHIPELISEINEKINLCCKIRKEAFSKFSKAEKLFYKELNLPNLKNERDIFFNNDWELCAFDKNVTSVKNNHLRFDASFNHPLVERISQYLTMKESKSEGKVYKLTDFVDISLPPRFKRQYVDKSEGIPLLQGTHISEIKPQNLKFISKNMKNLEKYIIKENWILLTISGTIGNASLVSSYWNNWAATNHFLRLIVNEDKINPGFLLMFLWSKYGQTQLKSFSYGAVVDEIGEAGELFSEFLVFKPNKNIEDEIGNLIIESYKLRDKANLIEDEVITVLENKLFNYK